MSKSKRLNLTGKRRCSKDQMRALENLIIQSKDISDLGKKFCLWFFRQSHGLTRRIWTVLPPAFAEESKIHDGMNGIYSDAGTTHISDVLAAMGTKIKPHFDWIMGGDFHHFERGSYNVRLAESGMTAGDWIPFDPEAVKIMPLEVVRERHGV